MDGLRKYDFPRKASTSSPLLPRDTRLPREANFILQSGKGWIRLELNRGRDAGRKRSLSRARTFFQHKTIWNKTIVGLVSLQKQRGEEVSALPMNSHFDLIQT